MMVAEYCEGGRMSFLLVPEGEGGRGWKGLREALVDYALEGRNRDGLHGGTRSYKDALVQVAPLQVQGGGDSGVRFKDRKLH